MSSAAIPIKVPQSGPTSWPARLGNNFLLRTLARSLFTVWLVTTLIFFIVRALPGSPVEVFVNDLVLKGFSEEEALGKAASLLHINLNRPLTEQYAQYMDNLAHGDLGKSYTTPDKNVSDLIVARLPWTVFSVGISLVVSFAIGMLLGMLIAYRRDSWLDHVLTNVAAGLDALPSYMMAIVLIILLSLVWKVIPASQLRGSLSPGIVPGFSLEFVGDVLRHVALPALVYVLATVGSWMLTMKSSTVSTLGEDYVTVARARGLPDSRIMTAYVGRNASLPLFTRFALSIAFVLGGSIIIEKIFTYQGIGLLLAQELAARDYPVIQGLFLITTLAVVVSNGLADLLYGFLDPRVRVAGETQ